MIEDVPLVVGLVGFIGGACWAINLFQGDRRHRIPAGSFGKGNVAIPEREWTVLLGQFLAQQRQAFGLLWFSVGLGLVLGGLFLGRLVLARELSTKDVMSGIGVVGDIWLGQYAWRLYTVASGRVERLLKMRV